jgi:hypothetical protein
MQYSFNHTIPFEICFLFSSGTQTLNSRSLWVVEPAGLWLGKLAAVRINSYRNFNSLMIRSKQVVNMSNWAYVNETW